MGEDTREMAPRPVDFSVHNAAKEIVRLRKQVKESESRRGDLERWCAEWLDDHDINSIKTDGGPTLYFGQPDLTVWVDEENKPAIHEWLKQEGEGSIIRNTWNYQTFRSVVRGRLRDGKEVHPAINVIAKPKLCVKANGYDG